MSPEQARGVDIDPRTDLFAMGSMLFEMLSGRPAFNGPTAIEALHAMLHDQPPALVGSLAVVDADRVIQRALRRTRRSGISRRKPWRGICGRASPAATCRAA